MDATFVEATVSQIDSRLAEITDESERLTTAKSALQGINGSEPAPTPAPRTPGKRGPGRPKGSGKNQGTRSEQAVRIVQENPGVTIPDIATKMGIEPNYLYRVLPKLAKDKVLRKDGQGWVAVEA